jgi:hypothetical protein
MRLLFVDFWSYQVSLELPVASLLTMVVGFMQSKSKLQQMIGGRAEDCSWCRWLNAPSTDFLGRCWRLLDLPGTATLTQLGLRMILDCVN